MDIISMLKANVDRFIVLQAEHAHTVLRHQISRNSPSAASKPRADRQFRCLNRKARARVVLCIFLSFYPAVPAPGSVAPFWWYFVRSGYLPPKTPVLDRDSRN